MKNSKGDTRMTIETNFLEQDRYRKKQNRTNTYDICDKRNTCRHGRNLKSKSHIKSKLKKESIYRQNFVIKYSCFNYD